MSHLDEDRLFRLVLGQLPQAETADAEAHLSTCADCKRRQDNLSSLAFASTLTTPAPSTLRNGPLTRAESPGAKATEAQALPDGKHFGRYVLLERLGAGGMGEVYTAYDPQLDRRVALKVLRAGALSASEGKARLLREAQAMARLQHPNVATVHDVGSIGDSIFIAMEFIEGETLGEWLRGDRRWTEVVRIFHQAGAGLAAAHEAGLVHRDFKPDNVLLGSDGRPRVVDFGLARQTTSAPDADAVTKPGDLHESLADTPLATRLTRDGAVMGTPGYMAPEQLAGLPTDARCDQFAFCVALYEGLYGKRPYGGATLKQHAQEMAKNALPPAPSGSPVPGWVHDVLTKGLSPNPDDRFPDMEALLAKLKLQSSTGRRATLIAGAIALVALGLAIWGGLAQQRLSLCSGAEKRLAGLWDAPARARLKDVVLASGLPYAADVWRNVEKSLDGYSQEWVAATRDACEATRLRQTDSEEAFRYKTDCLESRRSRLLAFTNLLVTGDREVVANAATAARSLDPIAGCFDVAALRSRSLASEKDKAAEASLRASLTEARALFDSGKYARGIEVLQAAVAKGAPPRAMAEALVWLGRLRVRAGEETAAGADFEQAATWALSSGESSLQAQSLARLAANHGYDQDLPDADTFSRLAHAAASRVPDDWEVQAELSTDDAFVALRRRKYKDALLGFEKALTLQEEHLGPQHPAVAMTLNNLGVTYTGLGEYENAIARYERSLTLHQSLEGAEHPNTASAEHNLAHVLRKQGRYSEAAEHYQHVLKVRREALGPEHPETLKTAEALARVAIPLDRQELALDLLESTLATRKKVNGERSKEVAQTLELMAELYSAGGYWKEAQAMAEQELAIYRGLGDKGLPVSSALHTLGGIQVRRGAWGDAKKSLDEAMAIRSEKVGSDSNEVAVVLNALADLALAQRRPAEALPLYVKALETRVRAGNATPEARAADLLGQGRSLVMLGQPAEAVVALEQATELTRSVEQASVVASTRLELGRALWLSDAQRRDEARAMMVSAYERVRSDERRDAEGWLGKLGVLTAADAGVP